MFRIIHPNRWFIWTIALIVMIFIVVWGAIQRYAIEQETEITGQNSLLGRETSKLDTTGWKTYRNEKYGFEVKYPNDWATFEQTDKGFDVSSSSEPWIWSAQNQVGPPAHWREISLYLNENQSDAFNYYTEKFEREMQSGSYQVCSSKKTINGVEGKKALAYICNPAYGLERVGNYNTLVEVNNTEVLGLYATYGNATEGSVKSTFNTMLSTLTFFEPKR